MSDEEKTYQRRRRGASRGPGWGIRIHEGNGTSSLNCLSLGDVMVYDSKEDAEADAAESLKISTAIGESITAWRARRYTVEWVAAGAWSPSDFDAALLALTPYAEPFARAGNEDALRAVNTARGLLSHFAPASLREPLVSGGSASEGYSGQSSEDK